MKVDKEDVLRGEVDDVSAFHPLLVNLRSTLQNFPAISNAALHFLLYIFYFINL